MWAGPHKATFFQLTRHMITISDNCLASTSVLKCGSHWDWFGKLSQVSYKMKAPHLNGWVSTFGWVNTAHQSFVYSCSVPFPLSSKPLILSSKPLQNSDSSFIWRILFKILSTFLSRLLSLIFQRKNWWSAMNYLVPTSLTAKGSLHTFDSVFPSIYLIHWNLTLPFLLHRSYFGKSHQWLWAFKSWIQVPKTPFPALFAWLTSMQISRLISLERL